MGAARRASAIQVAAARAMAADVVALEVTAALRDRGVRSLLLRGRALAELLYAEPASRSYVDVDLLVAPADRARAERTLRGLGFTPRSGLTAAEVAALAELDQAEMHAVAWARERAGVAVDLHRTLAGARVGASETWAALAAAAERLELGDGSLEVPSTPARALVVALHAAWHGRAAARPLGDLEQALERLPLAVWEEATRVAYRLDAVEACSAGLRLTARGAELADRLGLPVAVGVEIALRARSIPPTSLGFQRLADARGLGAKARLLARELVPTPLFMRTSSGVAQRGRAGIAAAYMWRPLWLLAHAGRGFAEWTRARRGAA